MYNYRITFENEFATNQYAALHFYLPGFHHSWFSLHLWHLYHHSHQGTLLGFGPLAAVRLLHIVRILRLLCIFVLYLKYTWYLLWCFQQNFGHPQFLLFPMLAISILKRIKFSVVQLVKRLYGCHSRFFFSLKSWQIRW